MIKYIIFKISLFLFIGYSSIFAQKNADTLYIKALSQYNYSFIDSSLQTINYAISINPKNILALKLKADIFFTLNNYIDALETFKSINELKNGTLDYEIVQCYSMLNEKDKAFDALKKYLQNSDKKFHSYIKLDKNLENIKNTKEWNAIWLEDWHSKYESSIFDAEYLISKKQYYQAIEHLTDVIDKKPKSHKAYFLRAIALENINNYRAAINDLNIAISQNKRIEDYYFLRGKMFLLEKKYKKANDDFKSCINLNPNNIEYYYYLATSEFNNDNLTEAKSNINFYLKYYYQDHKAFYLSAQIDFYKKLYLDALINMNLAISLDSSKYEYFTLRGNSYLNAKTYNLAENDFNMSLDLNPNQSNVWFLRGLSRINQSNKEGACNDWEKAFNLKNVDAVEYLKANCWK